jgi:TRAP-type C4-dicarboxylate transport system substrate-binding protein
MRSSVTLVVAFVTALLSSAFGQSITIKLGSLAPSGSPWDQGLRRIATEWSTLSAGKVSLKVYPGGIAGDEDNMIRKMRIGQLSAAGMSGVGMCRIFNGILAVQLPFLVRTDEELFAVLDKIEPAYEQEIAKQGFTVLAWSKVGWVHFFSTKPVVSPDDLRKLKFFVWAGDAQAVQIWKELGFHPVPLAITDLMSSLQSGMVEAFTTTALSAASYQWFNLTKNMCGMPWAPLIGGIVINSTTWNSIPAELRAQLLASAKKIGADMQHEIDKADADAVIAMQQHGLVVNPVPPEAIAQWEQATKTGFAKLAGESFDNHSYQSVLGYLKEFRAQHAK